MERRGYQWFQGAVPEERCLWRKLIGARGVAFAVRADAVAVVSVYQSAITFWSSSIRNA